MKPKKTVLSSIRTHLDDAHIGVSLWTEDSLQDITTRSGKLALANEYQVHYWALVLRHIAEDGSILDISIPTVFYNYPQKVSSVHIDFSLIDVSNISATVEPLHNMKVKELLNLLGDHEAQLISTPLNSLHRHPGGRSQSFSGTDLDINPKDPGIVYPLASAQFQSNFASIVAHSAGTTYLAHTEYRIANGGGDDTNIDYYKGRCCSYIKGSTPVTSMTEAMFGVVKKNTSYSIFNNLASSPYLQSIIDLWNSIDFEPDTSCIDEKHLSEAHKATKTNKGTYYPTLWDSDSDNLVMTAKERKDIITALAIEHSIDIYPESTVKAMSIPKRIKYYNTLQVFYYDDDYFNTMKYDNDEIPTVEDVIELQEYIIEQEYDLQIEEPAYITSNKPADRDLIVNYMANAIIDYGFSKTLVDTMSSSEIEAQFDKLQLGNTI